MLIKLISLFTIFFKIGIFGFGGGYAMLQLIYQEIERLHMMSIAEFNQLVSLSQITPGPIMVNAATYVGYTYSGFLGAVVATLAVSIPSFIYMYLIYIFLEKFKGSKTINAFLTGVRPATVGLLTAAVVYFLQGAVIDKTLAYQLFSKPLQVISLPALGIFILSLLLSKKFKFSPITIFIIAGVLGAIIL